MDLIYYWVKAHKEITYRGKLSKNLSILNIIFISFSLDRVFIYWCI